MKLYGYKDNWGDLLEILRDPGSADGKPGVEIGVAPQGRLDMRQCVILPEADARTMLKELADALGYHLVVKDGEQS